MHDLTSLNSSINSQTFVRKTQKIDLKSFKVSSRRIGGHSYQDTKYAPNSVNTYGIIRYQLVSFLKDRGKMGKIQPQSRGTLAK